MKGEVWKLRVPLLTPPHPAVLRQMGLETLLALLPPPGTLPSPIRPTDPPAAAHPCPPRPSCLVPYCWHARRVRARRLRHQATPLAGTTGVPSLRPSSAGLGPLPRLVCVHASGPRGAWSQVTALLCGPGAGRSAPLPHGSRAQPDRLPVRRPPPFWGTSPHIRVDRPGGDTSHVRAVDARRATMTTSASYPRNGAAPATPPRPSGPSSATWAVHEAPTSCSMRWHIGTMEMTYTMRGADEAEVSERLKHALPWLLTVVTSLENKGIPPAPLPWAPGVAPHGEHAVPRRACGAGGLVSAPPCDDGPPQQCERRVVQPSPRRWHLLQRQVRRTARWIPPLPGRRLSPGCRRWPAIPPTSTHARR